MSNKVFDIVLLFALPASGKSEVRNYLANIPVETLRNEFHIGDNLQLDDFPYVFMMKRIDQELEKLNKEPIFYGSKGTTLIDERDWGTLVQLLNDDYYDLVNRNVVKPLSAATLLFNRFDNAGERVGIKPRMALLPTAIFNKLCEILEPEAKKMLDDKQNAYPETMENKTIIIESARGGCDGAAMPLADPFGYQYSLRQFCPEILKKASILYIWVTPEESRRKNEDRNDPNDPGSNLHHSVPMEVMLKEYGCDDMEYLRDHSEAKDTITVKTYDEVYHLPIGVFDNRVDKTSFLRNDPKDWDQEKVKIVSKGIKEATDTMYENYLKKA